MRLLTKSLIVVAAILPASACTGLPRSTSCAGLRALRYGMTMDEVRTALGSPGRIVRMNGNATSGTVAFDTIWDFSQIGEFMGFTAFFNDSKLVIVEVSRQLWTRKIVFLLNAQGSRESPEFDRDYCR